MPRLFTARTTSGPLTWGMLSESVPGRQKSRLPLHTASGMPSRTIWQSRFLSREISSAALKSLCNVAASPVPTIPGVFSVPEPPEDAARLLPKEVDFALVPALALDPRGYRIGYGGGYYDRLLPKLSQARTCAVAFDFQLIAEVPELPFDVAVDLVVTDERVIRAS